MIFTMLRRGNMIMISISTLIKVTDPCICNLSDSTYINHCNEFQITECYLKSELQIYLLIKPH